MRKAKALFLSLCVAGLLSASTAGCVVKTTTTREPVASADSSDAPPATEKRTDVEVKPAVPRFHED